MTWDEERPPREDDRQAQERERCETCEGRGRLGGCEECCGVGKWCCSVECIRCDGTGKRRGDDDERDGND